MNILITGGAGYIGTELIRKIAESVAFDKIIVYDNLSGGNRNLFTAKIELPKEKIQFVQGDILDSRAFKKALDGIDVVFHLAANVTTPFSDQNPHLFEQVNHWGTAEVCYAVEESDVKRFIHLSSVSVYGTSKKEKDINSSLSPRTFYGISKMRAEKHVMRLMDKIDTYIIRCGNVYGFSQSMRFDAVINRFIFESNFFKRITVHGNGEQKRPFIHIDRVSLLLAQFVHGNISKGIFNLVDQNLAIGEIVEYLRVVYPDIEMLFVNQHMKMRELSVNPTSLIMDKIEDKKHDMVQELARFKDQFTF
ncbi:MAG: ADP-glyceromanno-heptose 6-epimerase [Verrucomicrobia bacterium]|nr:ADP-glyceromanno-heptose 6-epimerase [Verrucomicrobiota bacterium]